MKTDYKILWIDDNHDSVRGDVRSIRSFLENYGIELTVNQIVVTPDHCPTQEETFTQAISDIDLDMVFVDFNMPEQGDKIISHIRKTLHHYHLPILFYTGDDSPEKILTEHIAATNKDESNLLNVVDGIYFCDRDHIAVKATMILTSLLKKENKAQNGRGLLMDRVSEIDAKLISALQVLWKQVPAEKRPKIIQELNERVESRKNTSATIAQDIAGKSYDETLKYLLDDIRRWDTFARAKVLRVVLRNIDDKKAYGDVLSEFCNPAIPPNKNLIDMRNDYAHKASSEIIADHNDARCKYIRTETRRHLNNLKQILGETN